MLCLTDNYVLLVIEKEIKMDLITAIAIYFGIGVVFTLALEGLNEFFIPEDSRVTFSAAEQISLSIFWPYGVFIFIRALLPPSDAFEIDDDTEK
jgi:hypothetical protein